MILSWATFLAILSGSGHGLSMSTKSIYLVSMARGAEESRRGYVDGRFDLHKIKVDKRREIHLDYLWMTTCVGGAIGAVEDERSKRPGETDTYKGFWAGN